MSNANATQTSTRRGRPKANKVSYPHDEPLLEWPTDFDSKKHKLLEEEDFADECQYIYWDRRAEVYKERMLHAEQQAHLCRTIGGKEQREKAAKIVRLRQQIERMKEELGEDISAEDLAALLPIS